MNVELVYEQACPNIAAAREQLLRAFAAAGLTPHWREWDVARADAPAHARGHGSPTILVNGVDVTGEAADRDDLCCRIYADTDTPNQGVPPLARIEAALRAAGAPQPAVQAPARKLLSINLALLPAVGGGLAGQQIILRQRCHDVGITGNVDRRLGLEHLAAAFNDRRRLPCLCKHHQPAMKRRSP